MIISKESDCSLTFDSIEYICDCCNKSLMVTCMDDLKEFNEIFDVNAGYEDELYCFDCSENIKIELEIIEAEVKDL